VIDLMVAIVCCIVGAWFLMALTRWAENTRVDTVGQRIKLLIAVVFMLLMGLFLTAFLGSVLEAASVS
jgi:hypothetical protein